MKALEKSEWRLSLIAIASTIGCFLSIIIVQRELNPTFAMWFLAGALLVIAGNAIYVFSKRKRNNGSGNENSKNG